MKILVLGIGILLALALALPTAAAAPHAVQSASGGGYWMDGVEKCSVAFNAKIDAHGIVKGVQNGLYRSGVQKTRIKITGMKVDGNVAYFGGIVTSAPEAPEIVGRDACWAVIDNGRRSRVPDQISSTWLYPMEWCETVMYTEDRPIFHDFVGNIRIYA